MLVTVFPRPQAKVRKTRKDPVGKQFCTPKAPLWLELTLYIRPVCDKTKRT